MHRTLDALAILYPPLFEMLLLLSPRNVNAVLVLLTASALVIAIAPVSPMPLQPSRKSIASPVFVVSASAIAFAPLVPMLL